jgi:phosphinothricin acetyltransferase
VRAVGGIGERLLKFQIRPAIPSDLPDLVRIYNHYVANTHVTFDTKPFASEERRSWFEGFADSGPYRLLVAEVESDIAGYTSSTPFRPKQAYHTSVETTIYLDPCHIGRGLGSKLYGALLELLAYDRQVHRAYGGVALPNPASVSLHERLGFQLVGTFKEVGYKFERFWDVSWYEKDLSDRNAA